MKGSQSTHLLVFSYMITPSWRKVSVGEEKQAGAELCLAQVKLGLAKPAIAS